MLRISHIYSFKKEGLKISHLKMLEDQIDNEYHIEDVYHRFAAVLTASDLHLIDDSGLIFVSSKEDIDAK